MCNETHTAITACDAIHRHIERRQLGRGVVPCISGFQNLPCPSFAILSLSLPLLLLHQRCTKLTFRSPQELLAGSLRGISLAAVLSRTAHSFPGFVQSTTALLPHSCHPAPSALHCSRSTPVWEGGLPLHVCMRVCVRIWGKEREREERGRKRGRVGERRNGKDVNVRVCSLLNAPLFSFSTQILDLLSLRICPLLWVFVYAYLHRASAPVCVGVGIFVCEYIRHMAPFSLLQRQWYVWKSPENSEAGREMRVCWAQTGKEKWWGGVWCNQLLWNCR